MVRVWYKDYKGYTGVETNAESAEDVARNLEKEGFATDKDEVTGKPVYADKLIKILSENKPLVEKIKDGGSLLMSSMKNLMMKDEIEDIEDYSSTDIETDMGNTIVILKAPAKRNSMLPLSTPPPAASGGGGSYGGGRTNPNDSLTMLTVQALGGS